MSRPGPGPTGGATSVAVRPGCIAFRVQLERIGELFEAPDLDPFEEQLRVTAGIEDIVAHRAVESMAITVEAAT
jgi:hypothetical protein